MKGHYRATIWVGLLLVLALGACSGATATVTVPAPTATTVPTVRVATATTTPIPTMTPSASPEGTRQVLATPQSTAAVDTGGATVALRVGQTVAVPDTGLTLTFVAVENDSRCPRSPNLACVWAGEAKVNIEIHTGTTVSAVILTMPGMLDSTAGLPDNPKTYTVISGHRIQILSLEPHPGEQGRPTQEGYLATLLVRPAN